MDFRIAPQPAEFAWLSPRGPPNARTRTAAATFQGKKVVVQTPPCTTRLFKDNNTTLYLDLPSDESPHAEFAAWIESFETYASQNVSTGDAAPSPAVRNGSLRLMLWESCQFFDADGTFLKEAPSAISKCVCVLEFGGLWVTDRSWGLKLNVTQVQVLASEPRATSGGGGGGAPRFQGYAFSS